MFSQGTLPVIPGPRGPPGQIPKEWKDILDSCKKRIDDLENLVRDLLRRIVILECTPPDFGGVEFQAAFKEEFGQNYDPNLLQSASINTGSSV